MSKTVHLTGNGVRLEADLHGHEDGPAVILMHGGGQTRHAWKKGADALADSGFHAVSFDLRGHGGSDWSADGIYSLERYVDDAAAVLAQVSSPAALVGASMGGATALMVAARQPEHVAALVLVDVTPTVNEAGADRIVAFMQGNRDGFASVEEAADAVARFMQHRPRPSDPSGLRKNLREGEGGRLFWHWDPALFGAGRVERAVVEAEVAEAAGQVRCPTLLVRGAMSEVVGPENVEQFKRLIPHAEVIDIAGAAHMVAGDRNDPFNDAVIGFLERTVHRTARALSEWSS